VARKSSKTTEAKEAKVAWTEAQVSAALRDRYPAPAYAFLPQVADGTGASKSRTADALAFSLWPSRGLDLYGFEIKVARSDWTRELADPAKADAICAFCDFWYVVAGKSGIVAEGELPPTWGLIEPRGAKLVCTREAPRLTPRPMTRAFLAAVFRRVAETSAGALAAEVATATLERTRAASYQAGFDEAQRIAIRDAKRARDELATLKQTVQEFQNASGLTLDRWHGGHALGTAVKFVREGGLTRARDEIRAIGSRARAILQITDDFQTLPTPDPEDHE
jgi:hypothetical protein